MRNCQPPANVEATTTSCVRPGLSSALGPSPRQTLQEISAPVAGTQRCESTSRSWPVYIIASDCADRRRSHRLSSGAPIMSHPTNPHALASACGLCISKHELTARYSTSGSRRRAPNPIKLLHLIRLSGSKRASTADLKVLYGSPSFCFCDFHIAKYRVRHSIEESFIPPVQT